MADAKFEIERDGQTFEVTVPEGEDPNAALAEFTGEAVSEKGFMRGVGRGTRAVVGAVPKLVGGLGDIVAAGLNIPIASAERFAEATAERGLKRPVDVDPLPRFPTNRVETIEQLLTDVGFPESEGTAEQIQSLAAEFAIPGVGMGGALAKTAAKVPGAVQKVPGIVRGLGQEIAEFFTKTPARAVAAETGGAGGAATGRVIAEEEELGPTAQFLAEFAGGVGGGIAPTAGVNLARRAATKGLEVVAPFTEAGGARRAARAVQEASADPATAAVAAREAPEGVSPAIATEDPRLQAMAGRAMADDPAVEARITGGLARAEKRNLDELADIAKGTEPGDWQQRVVQAVAPEGTVVAKGQTDEMLSDANRAFKGAYDQAKGFPIETRVMKVAGGDDTMPDIILNAANDPAILVGHEVRNRVVKWLAGRFKATARVGKPVREIDGVRVHEIQSDDLLELRSIVRNEARRKNRSAAADTQAEGEILDNAARGITEILDSQLPDDALNVLRATDSQYRQFKTVEQASVRGAQGLTAGSLRQSIKSRESQGRVARGEVGPLGPLVEQGVDVKTILGKKDVQAAQRMIRTMTPEQRATTKADFTREIVQRAEGKIAGATKLKGARLLDEVEQNRAVLEAAGLEADDFARIERIGRELKMIQGRSTAKVDQLLTDNVGTVMRLVGAIAGSRAGTRALRFFGGAGGAGPSLILAQFGSRELQKTLRKLTVNRGDAIIRASMEDPGLHAALLIAPTDPVKQQAAAAKVINAWLLATGAETAAPVEEE